MARTEEGRLFAGLLGGIAALAFVLPASAVGQDGPPDGASRATSPEGTRKSTPAELDLRTFLRRVLERSPEVEAAARRREAAGHAADARRSPLDPTLEAQGPDSEGVAELALRQPLRIFGRGGAAARLADAERRLAGRRLAAERASVARGAAREWVAAVADRRELRLLEERLHRRRAALERGRAALRRGWGGRSLAELRLEVRAAERELDAARSEAERSRRRLRRRLGRSPGEPLELDGRLAADAGRRAFPPVPGELPPGVPAAALARARTSVAEAELARSRAATRPAPAVGPMLSVGEGLDPGVSLELSVPLWDRRGGAVRSARAELEASRASARASRRRVRAAYRRLLDRREDLRRRLETLRSRELGPARREVRRWETAGRIGMPVAGERRRARRRVLELHLEELRLQRRLTLVEVEAAWRSGSLLGWLRGRPGSPPGPDGR